MPLQSNMFIALSVAAAAIPASFQEPAALHPASATFVVQFPDVQGWIEAYSTTAVPRLMEDPDLQSAIGQVMGGEGADPIDPVPLLMAEYRAGIASGEIPPILEYLLGLKSASFSVDVAGSDVLAFFDGVESAEDQAFFASQNLGLRFVVDFVDESVAEKVTQFLIEAIESESPGDLEFSARALTMPEGAMGFGASGIRDWTLVPSEAGNGAARDAFESTMHLVAGGTRVAFFMGNVDSGDYIRALSTNAVPNPASSLFRPGRAAFKEAPGTPTFELYLRPFLEALVAREEPKALPLLDIAEALIGPAASLPIRGGHWRMGIEGGQFVIEGIHEPSRGGPLSGVIGANPLDRSALALVHPDALIASVTSLNADVLKNVIVEFAAAENPSMLDDIEERFGFRPERDLAGSLGDAFSYSLPQLTSLMSAPNLMGAVRLKDKGAFTTGMNGLMSMAEGLGEDVQLVRGDYKGAMMYTLSFTGDMGLNIPGLPIDPASFFKPTITIMDDRVLLTTLSTHAKKEVRRVRKLAKKGEAAPVHKKILAMGDLGGATTIGYADWPQFFGALYTQVKNLAPLLAGGGQLPIDPTMLPDAAVLTRYFKPSENWTRMKDGMVMQYAKSSLGTEASLLPMGLSVLLLRGASVQTHDSVVDQATIEHPPEGWDSGMDEGPGAGSPEALAAATEDALIEVEVALTLYQLDHKGAAPGSLDVLLQVSDTYPKGYLDEGAVPADGWGHVLVYIRTAEGYTLHSMGPNGVDDGGAGDDIRSN